MRSDIKTDRLSPKGSRNSGSKASRPDSRATKLSTKLAELVQKMPGSMEEDEVHKLRTTVRRLEVVLQNAPNGRDRAKLDAQLKTLRKRAGKVRDLDVHLGMLKELGSADQRACDELRTFLKNKRAKQARKLEKVLEAEADEGLEKRLKRTASAACEQMPDMARAEEQLASVRERFLSMTAEIPEDGAALHQLRIDGKRLRYEVEALSPEEDAEPANRLEAHAAELVEQLKRVQDEIGIWHDWLTLHEAATEHLHGPHAAPLVALLRTRAAAHYHNARRTVAEVRSQLERVTSRKKPPKAAGRAARSHSQAI